MRIKVSIDIKVGRVVKYLVYCDLFLLLGWGLIDPIFSIFVIQRISGATIVTVGVTAALYWILKSILQIPLAQYLDRTPGEKDDFLALVGGLLLAGFAALALSWITTIPELYAITVIHAIAFALYVPSWSAIFSRHLDKDRISFDWSLDSTVAGIAAGISGLVAGLMVAAWGFVMVFVIAGIFSLAAAFLLMAVPDLVLPKPKDGETALRDHTPANIGV